MHFLQRSDALLTEDSTTCLPHGERIAHGAGCSPRGAINEFQQFLEEYPKSPLKKDVQEKLTECRDKLAKKDYKNAELYRKMNEWRAAEIYYGFVIQNYYDTPFGEKALYWKGEAEYHQDKFKEARNTLAEYLRKFPDGSYHSKAKKRLRNIRKILDQIETNQTAQKSKKSE